MAYTAYFGTFAKKENSTKQPSYSSWASFDVTLKGGASLTRPIISLSAAFSTVSGFNYAVMLNRFYWIREITMERSGLCIMQLEIDTLATYKTDIGSASLYVLRAASSSNGQIKDNMYPALSVPSLDYQSIAQSFPDYEDGYYIINALGTTNNATTLYQMDFDTFRKVINSLFSQAANAQSIGSDFAQAVVNSMFNPIDYINWAAWTPQPFTGNSAATMYLGRWSYTAGTGDVLEVIKDTIINVSGSISIPKHPQAATRGEFLNFYPYTEYILNLQPYGMIPIDPKRVNHLNTLNYYEKIDAQSGLATLEIKDENTGSVLNNITCKYLVDIPIGAAADGKELLSSIVSGAAALITGNPAAGIAAGSAAIGSAVDFLSPQARSIGAQGSIAAFKCYQGFLSIFHQLAPEDNAHNGRPLCDVRTISTLSGFIQVQDGDVEAAAPLPELLTIKRYLESGFFYE